MELPTKTFIFYEIRCNITDEVYIGSTSLTLERRIKHHISDAKGTRSVCSSRTIILRGDYGYSIIRESDFTSSKAARFEEQNCIDLYKERGQKVINKIDAAIKISLTEYHQKAQKKYKVGTGANPISIPCPCGGKFLTGDKRHENTRKHSKWIMASEENREKMRVWAATTPLYRKGERFLTPCLHYEGF